MQTAFSADIQGFNKKTQREQEHQFLLSAAPLTCSFCAAGGPKSMIEVKTKPPIKYSMEAMVIEGQFAVLQYDPYCLYHRMTNAVATSPTHKLSADSNIASQR